MIMIITKIMIMIILYLSLSICEAGSLIGVTASRININTNIIVTKHTIITNH